MIRKHCDVEEDVVTHIREGPLRRLEHIERVNEGRLTQQIYTANLNKEVGKTNLTRPNRERPELRPRQEYLSRTSAYESMKQIMSVRIIASEVGFGNHLGVIATSPHNLCLTCARAHCV